MKSFLKFFLKHYLKFLAKLNLLIHRPKIIAIAGSTNKTFVKEEIGKVLEKHNLSFRLNPRNFNTEIGLPLAVLNLKSGYNFYLDWIPAVFKAPFSIFSANYPKILVLELGIAEPGDMKFLLSIIRPNVRVITDITQRYRESFDDMDELTGEYALFLKTAEKGDLVILNSDNDKIAEISKESKARVIMFSLHNVSPWQGKITEKTDIYQKIFVHGEEYKILRHGDHHAYALLIGLIIEKYVCEKK